MEPIDKALLSLRGLSVGDAFGATLGEGHSSQQVEVWLKNRTLPPGHGIGQTIRLWHSQS